MTLLGAGPCQVDLGAYSAAGAVATVAGVAVSVAAAAGQADGYWSGGMIEHADLATGRILRAMIIGHAGSALTLHIPLALVPGDAVTLVPGCDHSLDTCAAKFANAANFGGFPWTPKTSPYGGATIY